MAHDWDGISEDVITTKNPAKVFRTLDYILTLIVLGILIGYTSRDIEREMPESFYAQVSVQAWVDYARCTHGAYVTTYYIESNTIPGYQSSDRVVEQDVVCATIDKDETLVRTDACTGASTCFGGFTTADEKRVYEQTGSIEFCYLVEAIQWQECEFYSRRPGMCCEHSDVQHCFDYLNDDANCGVCGNECDELSMCIDGECVEIVDDRCSTYGTACNETCIASIPVSYPALTPVGPWVCAYTPNENGTLCNATRDALVDEIVGGSCITLAGTTDCYEESGTVCCIPTGTVVDVNIMANVTDPAVELTAAACCSGSFSSGTTCQ